MAHRSTLTAMRAHFGDLIDPTKHQRDALDQGREAGGEGTDESA